MDRFVRFQSTPPRRGRPRYLRRRRRRSVSIHAPAKGATTQGGIGDDAKVSFNPRPREGGDTWSLATSWSMAEFQSTPPRRGRPKTLATVWTDDPVSIHAPAKGATSVPRWDRPAASSFNPRPRAGGD